MLRSSYRKEGLALASSVERLLQTAAVVLLEALVLDLVVVGVLEAALELAVDEPLDADDVIARADAFEQLGRPLDLVNN